LPILKIDVKNGKIYTQDRVQNARGKWESVQEDCTEDFRALVDLPNVTTGWLAFPTGSAPQCKLFAIGEDIGLPPTPEFKEGLRALLKIAGDPAGVRELLSTSMLLYESVRELYDKCEEDFVDKPGLLPVVTVSEFEEIKTSDGAAFKPKFDVVGWEQRPRDLPAKAAPRWQPPAKPIVKDSMADEYPGAPPAKAAGAIDPELNKQWNAGKPIAGKRSDMDDEIPF
jgi:hypothetical protein